MASYLVFTPPDDGRAEAAVLVRDGVHVWAFVLPVVWLVWHRLWLEAVLALAAMALLSAGAGIAGFGAASPAWSLLVSLFFGLEAANLRAAALRRRGWRERGLVEADDDAAAEARMVVDALDADEGVKADLPSASTARRPVSVPAHPAPAHGLALGMLDYPGRR